MGALAGPCFIQLSYGRTKIFMANPSSQQKPRMGRPPVLGNGERVVATLRLTLEQDKAIRRAAKKRRQGKSEWMRDVLFEAAQAA